MQIITPEQLGAESDLGAETRYAAVRDTINAIQDKYHITIPVLTLPRATESILEKHVLLHDHWDELKDALSIYDSGKRPMVASTRSVALDIGKLTAEDEGNLAIATTLCGYYEGHSYESEISRAELAKIAGALGSGKPNRDGRRIEIADESDPTLAELKMEYGCVSPLISDVDVPRFMIDRPHFPPEWEVHRDAIQPFIEMAVDLQTSVFVPLDYFAEFVVTHAELQEFSRPTWVSNYTNTNPDIGGYLRPENAGDINGDHRVNSEEVRRKFYATPARHRSQINTGDNQEAVTYVWGGEFEAGQVPNTVWV